MKVLVTGGCGFIGSHFVQRLLAESGAQVVVVDALTYAAHPDTCQFLESLAPQRYRFYRADIASPEMKAIFETERPDVVVNFAAETHVDRSILDPGAFVRTNVLGVQNLLSLVRQVGKPRFVQVSTDEVYGSLSPTDPCFTEESALEPNSPYAASKASADLLALANHRTFHQDIVITRCSNNYGPFQFPEKLIPLVIANGLEGSPIPVYGDGQQVRDWIHVADHCDGVLEVLKNGKAGHVYNISADEERPNLDLIRFLLKELGKPESLMKHVGDRPAHDRRYGLNSSKIRNELNWKPKMSFADGMAETVRWYKGNETWWKKVRDKNYFQYYQANYQGKFAEPRRESQT